MKFTATVALGLEDALLDELTELGARGLAVAPGAVSFEGTVADAYRVAMWSRVAGRVLLDLAEVSAASGDALYEGAMGVPWADHLGPDHRLAVSFRGGNDAIRHRHYGAVRVKDAVCDTLRVVAGARPDVDREDPDVTVHAHVRGDRATLGIDLTGPPLHLRGRDRDGGPAPLRETLAAGILRMAGWHRLAPEGALLVDPLAGSGTLAIEAADIVRDRAPGLRRPAWGFVRWSGHDPSAWRQVQEEARDRLRPAGGTRVFASDRDPEQVRRLEGNLARADMVGDVRVQRLELAHVQAPRSGRAELPHGLLVTNPPYGLRLGETDEVNDTWRLLGDVLRRRFLGWEGWLLAGDPALAKRLGLRPSRKLPLYQGPLASRLLQVPIASAPVARDA